MCTMDDTLEGLVESGKVAARDAYLKANDKARFEALVKKAEEEPPSRRKRRDEQPDE